MDKSKITLDRNSVEVVEKALNSGDRVEIIPTKNGYKMLRKKKSEVLYEKQENHIECRE